MLTPITLTDAELHALTGYRRPADQLRTLHARGFHRAWRGPTGRVIVERAHVEAVLRGEAQPARPKVRPVLRVA